MLTRIRNGAGARKASVDVPWSRHKEAIARVLVDEGYLADAAVVEAKPLPVLRIGAALRQRTPAGDHGHPPREPAEPPRLRRRRARFPSVRRGLGVSVLSTPKGILADREARRAGRRRRGHLPGLVRSACHASDRLPISIPERREAARRRRHACASRARRARSRAAVEPEVVDRRSRATTATVARAATTRDARAACTA